MLALQPTREAIASAARQPLIALRMAGANLSASAFSDGEETVRTAAQRRVSRNVRKQHRHCTRDRVRFSVTAGPSILWFDTAFDAKGSVGLFVDLRPAGLRWTFPHRVALVFDPLSLAIVAPVLGDPGILQLEYRTVLGVEMILP